MNNETSNEEPRKDNFLKSIFAFASLHCGFLIYIHEKPPCNT